MQLGLGVVKLMHKHSTDVVMSSVTASTAPEWLLLVLCSPKDHHKVHRIVVQRGEQGHHHQSLSLHALMLGLHLHGCMTNIACHKVMRL